MALGMDVKKCLSAMVTADRRIFGEILAPASGDEHPARALTDPVRGNPNGARTGQDDPASRDPDVLGSGPAIVAFGPDILGAGRATDGADVGRRRWRNANHGLSETDLGHEYEQGDADGTEDCPQW